MGTSDEELLEWIGKASSCTSSKSACLGKWYFDDREEAEETARNMQKQLHRRFCVYKCFWCDKWHVGNVHPRKDKKRKKRMRKR